ncbi:hypothetical protein Ancab_030807 [Ancistrocladus abbreviatus]
MAKEFVDEELGSAIFKVFTETKAEELEKAKEECLEALRMVEEHALGDEKFVGGEKMGIADLAFGILTLWLECVEEISGTKLMDAEMFPRLHAWAANFKGAPVIRDNLPDRDQVHLAFMKRRETLLVSK